ncbi:MAG: hypothetical protein LIP77_11070, partial [Planctomycetes bacterium]|nr:hypothetical protein [Planctomycetota bacterium]
LDLAEVDSAVASAVGLQAAVVREEAGSGPEEALFYAYLTGEFLRRAGNLPLASEWFRVVLDLAEDDSAVATAARRQAAVVREEAGSGVNLLAAFGGDSALFDRVRRICGRQ